MGNTGTLVSDALLEGCAIVLAGGGSGAAVGVVTVFTVGTLVAISGFLATGTDKEGKGIKQFSVAVVHATLVAFGGLLVRGEVLRVLRGVRCLG